MIDSKTCVKCNVSKPRNEFHKYRKTADGLHPYCRDCRRPAGTKKRTVADPVDGIDARLWLRCFGEVWGEYIEGHPETMEDARIMALRHAQTTPVRGTRKRLRQRRRLERFGACCADATAFAMLKNRAQKFRKLKDAIDGKTWAELTAIPTTTTSWFAMNEMAELWDDQASEEQRQRIRVIPPRTMADLVKREITATALGDQDAEVAESIFG